MFVVVTMKDYTVYSSKAEDGTLRMALHPMDSAPNVHGGCRKPRITWPFRVVFCFRLSRKRYSHWLPSCRGNKGATVFSLSLDLKPEEREWGALMWLLEGEEQCL